MSSTKKITKTCTFFLCLEVAQKIVHTHFVLRKFGVVRCVIYFLLVSTSAGSPQLWFLDIFLGQVLSFFFLVSEPGRSEPGAVFFFCLVSEPGRSGPGALFFLLGIMGQIRGVPADG